MSSGPHYIFDENGDALTCAVCGGGILAHGKRQGNPLCAACCKAFDMGRTAAAGWEARYRDALHGLLAIFDEQLAEGIDWNNDQRVWDAREVFADFATEQEVAL